MPLNTLAPESVNNLRRITDFDKYAGLTSNNKDLVADYRPLNFDALLKSGALRVTHKGLDDKYDPDPMAGFSLVSGYNDAVGEQTRRWKDNPAMYSVVKDMLSSRPRDIGAHKYMQILQSARDMGLPDEAIFLSVK
jgi:hypothetical protein